MGLFPKKPKDTKKASKSQPKQQSIPEPRLEPIGSTQDIYARASKNYPSYEIALKNVLNRCPPAENDAAFQRLIRNLWDQTPEYARGIQDYTAKARQRIWEAAELERLNAKNANREKLLNDEERRGLDAYNAGGG
ncbi:hypothetical protein CLAFUW4_07454 [Fulvia fulva]|uniref:Uncharacterized protein n=1 Tax=Passalora fulva TaxID=5499 RepID=A0A9Q8PAE9_PASFU|nr:uncharacterized protein CLAFUR5_07584 [Fulvia fulva]KAK4621201.1 hypothetical protein CLAFUR4_07461 [Fulvia fulva]KAK4623369.1 hypothetical protein CLAFUR0_07460 [Fulvia fulva]UJO18847.1 hypothetical protein CLAFUR5_07584 [Fulvia fulva]WPV16520.1 hypothetical protein CLAFUW4_07454 [Fulvia fulva]WPV31699.1 hypothetical protein CLAFUW7_07457 [Fulvia fulva]